MILRLVLALALLAAVGAAAGGFYVWRTYLSDLPPIPDQQALWSVNRAPGMRFEDRYGRVIATRGPKHGSPVRLAGLPGYVPRAFLAAEDRRFYRHGALDWQGMSRAMRANLAAHRWVQGGSTITQQIAKTLFLKPDRTLKRKAQEAVIAWRLEQRMGKDEILELYLNRIFFGANAYGLDAAAQTYFAKPASQLTLPEAALLAALPKAPTRLALTNDYDAALARSRLVLANMREEGWITPDDERAALAQPPKLAPESPGEGDFGYVLDLAAAQAVKIAGETAPDLVVRLTIDPALQTAGQTIVRQEMAGAGRAAGARQAALAAMTPDGAIRALVGGVDHRLSPFNRAVQAQRQPGSSYKPFVYAAAVENGARAGDVRQDAPIRFGRWAPENSGGGYRGPVNLATALALSINTVAVRLGAEVGQAKLGEIAHRFGLVDIPERPDLSVSLGAYEVNLLELTSAYQVFQNAGGRVDPYLIEQISTSRGDLIFAHAGSAPTPVYGRDDAGRMVAMLEGVVTRGTGTRAGFGRPAAGKTGTSQNWRDAWFIGFTPDWIAGVWVGNDDERPMNKVTGGSIPTEIWRRFMVAAHDKLPPRDFDFIPVDQPGEGDGKEAVPDPRNGFYDGLSSDFARAADEADSDAGPPRREPDPNDPQPPEPPN